MNIGKPVTGRRPKESELYALVRQIRPLHRLLSRLVEQGLADTGITRPMRAVLEQLHEHGPRTVPQLARALMIRRQFVQRVVNELAAAGLAERRTNAAHKRSWLIAPTRAGKVAFDAIRAGERARIREVARNLDAVEVETCTRVLGRLRTDAATMLKDGVAGSESLEPDDLDRAAG